MVDPGRTYCPRKSIIRFGYREHLRLGLGVSYIGTNYGMDGQVSDLTER